MIQTAEAVTQVPCEQRQYVEKQIPKFMTEAIEKIEEVPQVLVEEMIVEVPQVQTAEVIRQVQKPVVQTVQKGIPVITTQVVEIVQQVPAVLINEVAMDVPQVQMVEVIKETAQMSQQRIVQQSQSFERAIDLRPEQRQGTMVGVYEAPVVSMRDTGIIQPTVVERLSPINAGTGAPTMAYGAPTTYAQETLAYETYGAPTMAYGAPTTYAQETLAYETYAAPTVYEDFAAPETLMLEQVPM